MKKIILSIGACLLFSLTISAQQDSTWKSGVKSADKSMPGKDKSYTDSSGKYYQYGKTKSSINNKSRNSKNSKRDKTDSINPQSK